MAKLGIHLDDTLGAVFVGLAGNLVLSGVAANMAVSYYKQYARSEAKGHALLVSAVLVIAGANSIVLFQGCYYYIVRSRCALVEV